MSFKSREPRLTLAEATTRIQDQWLLQMRPASLVGRMIAGYGRGIHSHSAKLTWSGGRLRVLEFREFIGARDRSFEYHVNKYADRIDVYRLRTDLFPDYDVAGANAVAWDLIDRDRYGYGGVLRAYLYHLPIINRWMEVDVSDLGPDKAHPFCSHYCSLVDRCGGGVDPVPELPDRITEPSDLSRSLLYRFAFTVAKNNG